MCVLLIVLVFAASMVHFPCIELTMAWFSNASRRQLQPGLLASFSYFEAGILKFPWTIEVGRVLPYYP